MELFDLLETRVVELLGQIDTLREENKSLQEKIGALEESNRALEEDNKGLKESLEQEQHTKEEINGRIDTLLSTIREFTAEANSAIPGSTAFSSMSWEWTFPSARRPIPLASSRRRSSWRSSMRD